jgi:hypothetical protein
MLAKAIAARGGRSRTDFARRLAWIRPNQTRHETGFPILLNAPAVALISKQTRKHNARDVTAAYEVAPP